nr:immunoglobulin light chain junction region [Macaca mulatta]MOX30161.1 immunoglobulin light chain junction region [Macaca mulatta]
DYYCQVCVLF